MHFVAALDDVPEMRAVLALFEGVATGAADGYGRMAGKPAATLLHLGPGLGNGLANLHNARRARTPIVNIVGDHATYHQALDAPLASDIVSVARNVSRWVRESNGPGDRRRRRGRGDRRGAARRRRDADPAGRRVVVRGRRARARCAAHARVARVADRRRSSSRPRRCAAASRPRCCSAASALRERGLLAASRIAAGDRRQAAVRDVPGAPRARRRPARASSASATSPSSRSRSCRGCATSCSSTRKAPVSFFAYPDKPSDLVPDGCEVHDLVPDGVARGRRARGAGRRARRAGRRRAARARGAARAADRCAQPRETIAQRVGALLPEGAIVSDEAQHGGTVRRRARPRARRATTG